MMRVARLDSEGSHQPPLSVSESRSRSRPRVGVSHGRSICKRINDARLEHRRHAQGTACWPRGKIRCPLVASRRGEMPNWSPFRVIVIFYRKW
jgi:hypothetical protein